MFRLFLFKLYNLITGACHLNSYKSEFEVVKNFVNTGDYISLEDAVLKRKVRLYYKGNKGYSQFKLITFKIEVDRSGKRNVSQIKIAGVLLTNYDFDSYVSRFKQLIKQYAYSV